jgi:hypothetical protein
MVVSGYADALTDSGMTHGICSVIYPESVSVEKMVHIIVCLIEFGIG